MPAGVLVMVPAPAAGAETVSWTSGVCDCDCEFEEPAPQLVRRRVARTQRYSKNSFMSQDAPNTCFEMNQSCSWLFGYLQWRRL